MLGGYGGRGGGAGECPLQTVGRKQFGIWAGKGGAFVWRLEDANVDVMASVRGQDEGGGGLYRLAGELAD